MKRLNYRVVLSILATLILAMVAVVPASAGPGQNEIWTGTLYWEDEFDCGEFKLVFGWTGWERVIIHWGTLQSVYQAHTRQFIYRQDDPESVIETSSNNWLIVDRWEDDKGYMLLGTWDNWVLPGIGHMWFTAGRFAWDSEGNGTFTGRSYYAEGIHLACPLFAE